MPTSGSFEAFLEGWLIRQQQFLNELITTQDTHDEGVLRNLIGRVLAHYQEYYEEKSRMSHRNVFLVFSPTWFSPLERSFLWIAGFKPGLAFSLVMNSIDDLSEGQVERLNWLRFETKVQERNLMDELAKIQESVASPPFMGAAQQLGSVETARLRGRERGMSEVDENMETLRTGIENVVTDADRLRTRTAERVVGILSPLQGLRFLTAAAQLQLRLRMLGMQREAERQEMVGTSEDGW